MGGRLGRKCIHSLILLILGAAVGLAALVLVFCLPVEPMREHVWQSLPMIEQEFESFTVIEGYPGTLSGNFTDCLMLEHAVYENDEHSLLNRVLYMYRGESSEGDGWAPGNSLMDYLEYIPQSREVEYARYWHGYLVFLKPLLMFTSFNSLRVLAAVAQLMLVGVLVMNYAKRGDNFLGFAFLASVPFLYFFSLYFSLSLSICFYLVVVILAAQQSLHEWLIKKDYYCEFFLIAGMATSYFDFLTYPLITLGFPLAVALYREDCGWKKALGRLAGCSAQWCAGYLGLWACKWALTDLLAGGNVIPDALNTLRFRTGVESDSLVFGFLHVLRLNMSVYLNRPFALLAVVIGIVLLRMSWKNRKVPVQKRQWREGIVIALIALFPFGWFLVTQNHSQQHWMFTCKILSVTVFAVLCAAGKVVKARKA